jgi:hypothetical protein
MKKALLPVIASLLLCGAATAALREVAAAAEPTGPHRPADQTQQRRQMCQDAFAHEVGTLAYLEAKLNLSAAQQLLFERWKSVRLDIAKRGEADCATREFPAKDARARPTPMDDMAREEDMLKRRLADLDAERPALAALYNGLNQNQKEALTQPAGGRIIVHRILADMGPPPRGLDRNGPAGLSSDGPPPP